MGQIRTPDCEKIDAVLRELCSGVGIDTQKDSYSLDYMVWVTVDETIHPIRLTVEEYDAGDWIENMRQGIELLKAAGADD